VLAAGLASVTTWLATSSTQETASLTQTLIADHKRGLLSGQPVDIASSDRHTVKPWFDSHFALAPQVVDLGTEGFPLAGGRIEVIGGQPVPTLVYRRREHLISLTALPAGTLRSPGTQTVEGYSILGWRMGETDYWAVSNLDPSELEKFRQAFETAIKGG